MAHETLFAVRMRSTAEAVDDATQRWYVLAEDVSGTAAAIISNFYQHDTGGVALGNIMHPAYNRDADGTTLDAYDVSGHLDGSPHGSPIFSTSFELSPAHDGEGLPPQLAVVADYHSAYGSAVEFGTGTRPRSRLRNRHYWGALGHVCLGVDVGPDWKPLVATAATDILQGAYSALAAGLLANWCTWSRKNAAFSPVTTGWIDSLLHTQRRRLDPVGAKLPLFA